VIKKRTFFEHTNYRELLKCLINDRKEEGKPFSFRWFSQKAGYSSPNFLKLILEGKRNLTDDAVDRLSHVFQFSAKERTFFRILVQLNQAKTPDHKESLVNDLLKFLGPQGKTLLSVEQYNYYAKWYYIPLRELIAASGGGLSVKEMSRRLQPNLTADQVQEALITLKSLGLIVDDEGRWKVTEKLLTTGDEVTMVAVTHYHLNMLRLAGESISRFSRDEREVSSVTLSLTPAKAMEAKRMIQEFRKKLWALETEEPEREVYQINFQLFPMTSSKKAGAR
jgi:uncharacterized protein (TIGR02147 family)